MRSWLTFALVTLLVAVGAPLRAVVAECVALAHVPECDCCVPAASSSEDCAGTCELDEAPAIPADGLVVSSTSRLRLVEVALFRPSTLRLPVTPATRTRPRGESRLLRPSFLFPSKEPTRGPPVRA